MSFFDTEFSPQSGRPVYFLKVKRGIKEWYYTNADQDLFFDGHNYLAVPMEVPDILMTGDAKAEEVQISLPSSTGLCQYLDGVGIPSTGFSVFLRKGHVRENENLGTFSAPPLANTPVIWLGELYMVRRPSVLKRVLVCNTMSLSMQRVGLRLTWSRTCPHMLYKRGCLVDREAYRIAIAGVTITGPLTISVPEADAQVDGWFSGGYVEWESEAGVFETRGIELHVGATLNIFGNTRGMNIGSNYSLFPGCDRLATTCDSKFNNMPNYGGINHMQGKSPYDGSQVF